MENVPQLVGFISHEQNGYKEVGVKPRRIGGEALATEA